MWLPIDKNTGNLVDKNFQVHGGNFVFPSNRFGIDFSSLNGVVELIWPDSSLSHMTEPSVSSSSHTRLGLSCETPLKSLQTLDRINSGFYDDSKYFFRDVTTILSQYKQKE